MQKEMRDKLSELIEKSINPCEHAIGLRTGKLYVTSLEMAEYLIDNGVAVRDKGYWVQGGTCEHKPYRVRNTDKWTTYKCSVCGYGNGRRFNTNFCPNCGADMREEKNNE